ncbi:MAG: hypothetical protein KKA64_04275 [Nanoarchaeota archaeon]|nr:hypothetical protein [Nanoarchaeota archaeon]
MKKNKPDTWWDSIKLLFELSTLLELSALLYAGVFPFIAHFSNACYENSLLWVIWLFALWVVLGIFLTDSTYTGDDADDAGN